MLTSRVDCGIEYARPPVIVLLEESVHLVDDNRLKGVHVHVLRPDVLDESSWRCDGGVWKLCQLSCFCGDICASRDEHDVRA